MISLSKIAYARLCHLLFSHNSFLCASCIYVPCVAYFKNALYSEALYQTSYTEKTVYRTSNTRISTDFIESTSERLIICVCCFHPTVYTVINVNIINENSLDIL